MRIFSVIGVLITAAVLSVALGLGVVASLPAQASHPDQANAAQATAATPGYDVWFCAANRIPIFCY